MAEAAKEKFIARLCLPFQPFTWGSEPKHSTTSCFIHFLLSSKHQDPRSRFFLPLNTCHYGSTMLFSTKGLWCFRWPLCLVLHLLNNQAKLWRGPGRWVQWLCAIRQGFGFTFLFEWRTTYGLTNAFYSSKSTFLVHPKLYLNSKISILTPITWFRGLLAQQP